MIFVQKMMPLLLRVLAENPSIEDRYPEIVRLRKMAEAGTLAFKVIEPPAGTCSSCGTFIAPQTKGRKREWPNFCPNCGKRKQDVGGTCSRPVYA